MFAGIFSCTPSFSPEINKVYLILSYLILSYVTNLHQMGNKSGIFYVLFLAYLERTKF